MLQILMVEVKQSGIFRKWRNMIKDERLRALIAARISRLSAGLAGDVKPIGAGLSELRIHYGAGYRIYYMQKGNIFIVLLCGGDKSAQKRDIEKAKAIAKEWKD